MGGAQYVQPNLLLSPSLGFSSAWVNHDTNAFSHLPPHSQMGGNHYQNSVPAPAIMASQTSGPIWQPQGSPWIAAPRFQDFNTVNYNRFHASIKTQMRFVWKPEYSQVLQDSGIISWTHVCHADLQDARLGRHPALQVALKQFASVYEMQYTKLSLRKPRIPGIESDLMDMLRHHVQGSCSELHLSSLVKLGILSCSDAVRAAAHGDFTPFSKSGVPQQMRRPLGKLAASFSATGLLCLTCGFLMSANLPLADEHVKLFETKRDSVRAHSVRAQEGVDKASDVLRVFDELLVSVKDHMKHPLTDEDSQDLWDMGILSPTELSFVYDNGYLDTFLILRSPLQAALTRVAKKIQGMTAPVMMPSMEPELIDILETHMQQPLCRFMRSSLVNLGILTCTDAAIAASEGKCGALSLSGIPMDLRRPICHVASLQNARRKTHTDSEIDVCHVDCAQGVNQETSVETSGMADQSDDPIQPSSYVMGVSSSQTDVTETHLHSPYTIALDSVNSQRTEDFRRATEIASMSGTKKVQRRKDSTNHSSTQRATRNTIIVPESSEEQQYHGHTKRTIRARKSSQDTFLTFPSVILKKSNIPGAGLGVFAVKDIEPHTLVSEYGGEVISIAEGALRRANGKGTHVRSMGMHSVGKSSWLLDSSVTADFPIKYYVEHHMMGGFVNGSKTGAENAVYYTSNVVCLGYIHPYTPRQETNGYVNGKTGHTQEMKTNQEAKLSPAVGFQFKSKKNLEEQETGVHEHKRKRAEYTNPLCHPYRCYIKSSKLIKAGEEILTNYGATYWNFDDELHAEVVMQH